MRTLACGLHTLTEHQDGHSCWPDAIKDWGHATSPDLYSWTDHEVAIPATAKDGSIWSGSVFVDVDNVSLLFPSPNGGNDSVPSSPSGSSHGNHGRGDNVIAYFTSWTPHEEAQSMAYSVDGGFTFTPYSNNPIISLDRHQFRDPKVIFHRASGKWVMTLTLERGVTFYTSTNLRDWVRASDWMPRRYLGVIECPQLIEIPLRSSTDDGASEVVGSAFMLTLSLANGGPGWRSAVRYVVGDFDGTRFHPRGGEDGFEDIDFDFGPDVYATAFFHFAGAAAHNDSSGSSSARRLTEEVANAISISWATSLPYAMDTPTPRDGWRHCMGGAREHWLDAETYRLVSVPVTIGENLRLGVGGGGDSDGSRDTKMGFNPIIVEQLDERVAGLQVDYGAALRRANPPVEFDWTVYVPSDALGSGETASVELRFETARGAAKEFVALQFDVSGPEAEEEADWDLIDLEETEKPKGRPRVPTATFTMRRGGMAGWRVDSYSVEGVRALISSAGSPKVNNSSDSSQQILLAVAPIDDRSPTETKFTVHGILDRSILEVYVNGGVEAGTLLYFADGILDRITLRPVSSSSGSKKSRRRIELMSTLRAEALRSAWPGNPPTVDDDHANLPESPVLPPNRGVPDDGRGSEL